MNHRIHGLHRKASQTAAVVLMIVALARPQDVEEQSRTNAEGIDIMLAIDISSSMLARDFQPDRLTAAKEVAAEFIADRCRYGPLSRYVRLHLPDELRYARHGGGCSRSAGYQEGWL